ncbi:DUF1850 domain-containing protein [Vreelandella glaciei]|uniref:DUF1850 domain-containing protein n=1 Tax=Vreelandella glaciei TaxID=186761 RepID=UPI0030021101
MKSIKWLNEFFLSCKCRAVRVASLTLFICSSIIIYPAASHANFNLEIKDSRGEVLLSYAISENDTWCIYWNHSVAGILVKDCYIFSAGDMLLKHSFQPHFAAGLGHIIGRGEQLSGKEGGYLIDNINEKVPGNTYYLRVGGVNVNHRILYKEKDVSLSDIAPGERVSIGVSGLQSN